MYHNFSFIHKFHNCLHILKFKPIHYNDWMRCCIMTVKNFLHKKIHIKQRFTTLTFSLTYLKIWAASTQHHSMCFQKPSSTRQSDVDHLFTFILVCKNLNQVICMIIPSEIKLLSSHLNCFLMYFNY
jgi:hypothetical protein